MTLAIIDATHHAAGDAAHAVGESRYTMPLANVPLVAHVLSAVTAAGADRARVLAAPGDRPEIERTLAHRPRHAPPLEIVEAPASPPHRAVLAELDAALSSEAVLLVPGDGLYRTLLAELATRFSVGDVDAVLDATAASAEPRLGGSAVLLGPGTRPLIGELLGRGGDASLVGALLESGLALAVCELAGGWVSDGGELLTGNRRALDALPDAPRPDEIAEGNELRGRIEIGRRVLASGCVLHGPVAIADGAVLEDSFIGPFTSIGPGALVSGAEIEDSIVLAGAELRHPGHRITASVIGAGARVDRGFTLPRGVRLHLGPGSQIRF